MGAKSFGGRLIIISGLPVPPGSLTPPPKQDKGEKLAQDVVLYMGPELINGNGAYCGGCALFIRDLSHCAILSPAKVDEKKGVCGLYIPGTSTNSTKMKALAAIPAKVAGYIEDGPTKCGTCEYFLRKEHACQVVEGKIEAGGCCNRWEEED